MHTQRRQALREAWRRAGILALQVSDQVAQTLLGVVTVDGVVEGCPDQASHHRPIFLLGLCELRDYADEAGFGKL